MKPYFQSETLDDVMRALFQAIWKHGTLVTTSRGPCKELTGAFVEITNARARISRTETRGKPFSCLGELCWYLSRTNELNFIEYYIPDYKEEAEDGIIYGGYGPRLFNYRGTNQVQNVISLLKSKPTSRRAAIQLFDSCDLAAEHKEIPCTCTLQFLLRDGKLNMVTYMRSNDAYKGLPHDIFCFTMLQEIFARSLGVELGSYKHTVGSLHLYEADMGSSRKFIDEGWQTTTAMLPMPEGDPWPAIEILLSAESSLRLGNKYDETPFKDLDPYWQDLVRLLQVLSCVKQRDVSGIEQTLDAMSSDLYDAFIQNKLQHVKSLLGK